MVGSPLHFKRTSALHTLIASWLLRKRLTPDFIQRKQTGKHLGRKFPKPRWQKTTSASTWTFVALNAVEAFPTPQYWSASFKGMILMSLSSLDHYYDSDEWRFTSLPVGRWQIRGRCNETASSPHQSFAVLGHRQSCALSSRSPADLLTLRSSFTM